MAHVQQAGAVAFRRATREPLFLVVTSRRSPADWIFPKGHIEAGEEAAAAATRELSEEAGVAGKALELLGKLSFRSGSEDVDCRYYLVEASNEGQSREGRQTRWLPAAEARRLLSHEESRKLLDKATQLVG